jgi:hypothetical protein
MDELCEKLKRPDHWPRTFTKMVEQRRQTVMAKLSQVKGKMYQPIPTNLVVSFSNNMQD